MILAGILVMISEVIAPPGGGNLMSLQSPQGKVSQGKLNCLSVNIKSSQQLAQDQLRTQTIGSPDLNGVVFTSSREKIMYGLTVISAEPI